MTKKTLCIYHSPCIDGIAAAWVVRQALGDRVELHPAAYGDAPPDVTGRDVILVDFSYKRDILLRLIDQAHSVLILDHHKTAQQDLVDLPGKAVCVFDMERSGAMLAWDHFFPQRYPPLLLDHVQDRDLWRFRLPLTREITAAVFSYPATIDTFDELQRRPLRELEQEGIPLERKHHKDIDELLKTCTRPMTIAGHSVPVANLPYTMASDAAGHLAEGMPFAATYYDTEKERVFSLRSHPSGLDVSKIAEQYGGGGHKHAAGFRVPLAKTCADHAQQPGPLPSAQPETLGVALIPEDLDRLERIVEKLQQAVPAFSIDDCVNLVFMAGMAVTEMPEGAALARIYAPLAVAA